jgi:nucleoside-specific outer membrane channel protein Tsx
MRRRPVMYLAGVLLATGASLALAGPASAHAAGDKCKHRHNDGGHNLQVVNAHQTTFNGLVNAPILSSFDGSSLIGGIIL